MHTPVASFRYSSARHPSDRAHLRAPLQVLKSWSRSGVGFVPLAADGKIFISLASGAVIALEESTGKEVWSLALGRAYSLENGYDGACLLVKRGLLIYFDHQLLTVDPATGAVIERQPVPRLSLKGAVSDGDIIVSHLETSERNSIGAIDLSSGAIPWKHSWSWASPFHTAAHGMLCVSTDRTAFSGIGVTTGKQHWTIAVGELGRYKDEVGEEKPGEVVGVPLVVGNSLFVAIRGHHIGAVDIVSGKQLWIQKVTTRNPFNLSFYPDGKLYVLGYKFFHLLDAQDGAILDEHDCEQIFKSAQVAGPFTDLGISDEYIYAADFTGVLIAFHKTRHTIDWTFRCKSKVAALDAPLVLENRLYVLDGRGNLDAFEGS